MANFSGTTFCNAAVAIISGNCRAWSYFFGSSNRRHVASLSVGVVSVWVNKFCTRILY